MSITVDIQSLTGIKLSEKSASTPINFDVNVKLEERERKSGKVTVNFLLVVNAKPSLAKFEVGGTATVTGAPNAIEKILEVDPKTKVPFLLHRVYQHVFMSIFLLSTLIDTPYPPPDLIFSSTESKPASS